MSKCAVITAAVVLAACAGRQEAFSEAHRLLSAGDNRLGPTPPPQPTFDSNGNIEWPQ